MIIARLSLRPVVCWRLLSLVTAASLLALVAFILAVAAADPLLVVRTAVTPADIIVVLGGDGPPRAAHAAALFRAGLAPRVLISGAGDCDYIRTTMIAAGVPSDAIVVECASRSTIENAAFSAPIFGVMGVSSALLVTSPFHTRRAFASFRNAMPRIHWMSAPVERSEPLWRLIWKIDGRVIAMEYIKVIYYALRQYVPPYAKSAETHGQSRGSLDYLVPALLMPSRSPPVSC